MERNRFDAIRLYMGMKDPQVFTPGNITESPAAALEIISARSISFIGKNGLLPVAMKAILNVIAVRERSLGAFSLSASEKEGNCQKS